MHARNPCPIDDEAKLVDARTLNGFKASAAHARETILSHTNILWAKDGGIAREREDLPNLSPEDVDTATSAVNGRPSLSSQRQHLAEWPIAPDVVSTPDVVQEECDRYGIGCGSGPAIRSVLFISWSESVQLRCPLLAR